MMLGSPGPGMMDMFMGDDGAQLEIVSRKLSGMEPDDEEFEEMVKKRRELQRKVKIKELEMQLKMAEKSSDDDNGDDDDDSYSGVTFSGSL